MKLEPAIAPAFKSSPLINEASRLTLSSFVKTAPTPALNKAEFSIILIDSSTASLLDPPFFNIAYPVFTASSNFVLYAFSSSADIFSFRIVPAPP